MKRHIERRALRVAMVILALLTILTSVSTAQAAPARSEVVNLVRALRYGAGIHQFKNYILRGQAENHRAAKTSLNEALMILERLETSPGMKAEDLAALVTIETMVTAYKAGLERVAELRTKGWRLEDIDRSVTVDDSEAIEALDRLRGKWPWSDLEEIEFQLGYGKSIHNFKNYVLRQQERYHTLALENLLAVESLIVNQFNTARLSSEQRTALENIGRVAQSYRNYLGLIGRLHALQRSERQIDLAVKINDKPALAGLSLLAR